MSQHLLATPQVSLPGAINPWRELPVPVMASGGSDPLLLLLATDSTVMTDFLHYNSSEQNTPKYEMKCVPVVCKAN